MRRALAKIREGWLKRKRLPPRLKRGSALLIAMVIVIFLLPITSTMVKSVMRQSRTNFQERNLKTARVISNDIFINFMRIHSDNYYMDHYDTRFMLSTDGSDNFLNAGVSGVGTVVYQSSASATGKYFAVQSTTTLVAGRDQNLWGRKGAVGVIAFENDITRFGQIFLDDAVFNSASFYRGKTFDTNIYAAGRFHACGQLDVAGLCGGNLPPGAQLTIQGTVIAGANVHAGLGNTLEASGAIYYPWTTGGVLGAGTFNGPRYAFTPEVAVIPPDPNYYMSRYNLLVGPSSPTFNRLVFGTGGAYGQVSFPDAGYTFDVPPPLSPQGAPSAVIVSTGMDITVSGIIRGRFTIVCVGCNVIVKDDFVYHQIPSPLPVAGCTGCASWEDSMAVVAGQQIRFESSAADPSPGEQTVSGLYFSATNSLRKQTTDGTYPALKAYGTLIGYFDADPAPGGTPLSIRQDPNLRRYWPPQMPERPVMVNRSHGTAW